MNRRTAKEIILLYTTTLCFSFQKRANQHCHSKGEVLPLSTPLLTQHPPLVGSTTIQHPEQTSEQGNGHCLKPATANSRTPSVGWKCPCKFTVIRHVCIDQLQSSQVILGWKVRQIIYKWDKSENLRGCQPNKVSLTEKFINSVKVQLRLALWATESCKIRLLIQSPKSLGVFQCLWPQTTFDQSSSYVLNGVEEAQREIQRRLTESEIRPWALFTSAGIFNSSQEG